MASELRLQGILRIPHASTDEIYEELRKGRWPTELDDGVSHVRARKSRRLGGLEDEYPQGGERRRAARQAHMREGVVDEETLERFLEEELARLEPCGSDDEMEDNEGSEAASGIMQEQQVEADMQAPPQQREAGNDLTQEQVELEMEAGPEQLEAGSVIEEASGPSVPIPEPSAIINLEPRQRWGSFSIGIKKGTGWEAVCRFHARNTVTGCKKFITWPDPSDASKLASLNQLRHWCNCAGQYHRQREHVAFTPVPATTPSVAVVQAQKYEEEPPAHCLNDIELDQQENEGRVQGPSSSSGVVAPQPKVAAKKAAAKKAAGKKAATKKAATKKAATKKDAAKRDAAPAEPEVVGDRRTRSSSSSSSSSKSSSSSSSTPSSSS